MDELGDIRLVDLVGEDSILGALMKGQPTVMYHALDAFMSEFQPSLTTLDVLGAGRASTIAQSFSSLTQV
jgi:hypothetical protein